MASKNLRSVLVYALAEVDRAKARAGGAAGRSATKFDRLAADLQKGLSELDQGGSPEFPLLAKWVADWIPDPDDQLLNAMDSLEAAASKSR